MKAILYIGHGTRSEKGVQELKAFIEQVKKRCNPPIQEFCFLKLTKPSISSGFKRCVERGATEITIVPLFLLAAGHIKEDIPRILSSLRETYPTIKVNVRNPLGVKDKILTVMADNIRKNVIDLTGSDGILIVGVGGSDPGIPFAFEEIKTGIKNRLEIENITVSYLAAAKPNLQEGLELISNQASNRVIVVPYLFFYGELLNIVNQKINKWQKQGQQIISLDPLCKYSIIEDIVVQSTVE
ncbi:sirohydrochlorin chelatase [Schinkia sp. CFF1]